MSNLNETPKSNRKHIVIYGKTNSGKSSLINRLIGQDIAIVSKEEGTTTDPVSKAMELLPAGPVLFTDTAGIGDKSSLGSLRVKKTLQCINSTDIAIYLMDINDLDFENYREMRKEFKKFNINFILVINKIDEVDKEKIDEAERKIEEFSDDYIFVSTKEDLGIIELKDKLIDILLKEEEELPIVGDLLPYNSTVVLVIPVDSEAPKGRLILPQVQCIRDCLDHGIKSYVVRDTELEEALKNIKNVDLVITDSQAFKTVNKIVPESIPLTSFSMLLARQKGDIKEFIEGVNAIRNLKPGDKILISESCTHNISHEDIGRVKIPKLLNKFVGGELDIQFRAGHNFPEDIEEYKLVIHCGACMITRKTVLNRIELCREKNVNITNYGVTISFLTDTLERSKIIFNG
ncbi:iron-only hydrogenase maturation protein HydF [Clostridium sp. DSM 8431]|uniref:[FeFe] hydrogenase H-cluster maturation GTPase HydF n=1 Tax=Clostridium sp. DSM 8431 TaxID=1761781 RepID=UPI0008E8C75A|nr:[FeFe] hydrogenase H-cluster maturation GTPase HydF [Clostridium sp. DSM 8431]SFU79314.1 iron-only hydrogenase maturation protein HydF [Clostridium sp. DSM 8431]